MGPKIRSQIGWGTLFVIGQTISHYRIVEKARRWRNRRALKLLPARFQSAAVLEPEQALRVPGEVELRYRRVALLDAHSLGLARRALSLQNFTRQSLTRAFCGQEHLRRSSDGIPRAGP